MLLHTLLVEVASLECIKELYVEDADFAEAWTTYKAPWSMDQTLYLDYHIQEGFLFRNQYFCIPQGSTRMNLIRELHSKGLDGDFGIDKTTMLVTERYFWPNINKDAIKFVECFRLFHLERGRTQNIGDSIPHFQY